MINYYKGVYMTVKKSGKQLIFSALLYFANFPKNKL